MKLGFLVPEWPAQTHAFFWREAVCLREMGHEVLLLSTRRAPEQNCRHAFAEEARRTTVYLFPPPAGFVGVLATRPIRFAKAFGYTMGLTESSVRQRIKIAALIPSAAALVAASKRHGLEHVHIHSCADAAHVGALARLLGGPPFSITVHGDLPVYGVDHGHKMRAAEFVRAVTSPLRDQVLAIPELAAHRVPVITMGVDTGRFAPRNGPRSKGPFRLLTVARLHPAKGHVHVIEAVRRLREEGFDVEYWIAGDGPHREAIENEVRDHRLTPHVQLLGTLGETEVLDLLQRADAFVLASEGLGEAAPVSVMEAMSCGLPVVCSRIGGTGDMIRDGDDGILTPMGDVERVTASIRRLIENEDFRVRLGAAARTRAIESFDARTCAKRLHEEIAAGSG